MAEPETQFDEQGRAYIEPADLLKSPKVQQQYAAAKRVMKQTPDDVTRRADLLVRLHKALRVLRAVWQDRRRLQREAAGSISAPYADELGRQYDEMEAEAGRLRSALRMMMDVYGPRTDADWEGWGPSELEAAEAARDALNEMTNG